MNNISFFPPADVLSQIRDSFTSTLTVSCSVWRDTVVTPGLSTGVKAFVKNTKCGVNLSSGGSTSPFINAIMRAVTVKQPGSRTLSFSWDDDIQTGDVIVLETVDEVSPPPMPINVPRYRLGLVNDDDPLRFGLQVPADLLNVPN